MRASTARRVRPKRTDARLRSCVPITGTFVLLSGTDVKPFLWPRPFPYTSWSGVTSASLRDLPWIFPVGVGNAPGREALRGDQPQRRERHQDPAPAHLDRQVPGAPTTTTPRGRGEAPSRCSSKAAAPAWSAPRASLPHLHDARSLPAGLARRQPPGLPRIFLAVDVTPSQISRSWPPLTLVRVTVGNPHRMKLGAAVDRDVDRVPLPGRPL